LAGGAIVNDFLTVLVMLAAISGLYHCFEVARCMSIRTSHSIRIGYLCIGIGCICALGASYQVSILLLLAGMTILKFFNRRTHTRDC
jgi:hypothetical protein